MGERGVGGSRHAATVPIRDWSRRGLLFEESEGLDFLMAKFNQGPLLGVNKAGGSVAEHNRGLLDNKATTVAQLDHKGSKRLAMQVLPQQSVKLVFGHLYSFFN